MEISIIVAAFSITFSAYAILIQPGELLSFYPALIYKSKLPEIIKKMIVCPYCIAGRWSLYVALYLIIFENIDWIVLLSSPINIILIYLFIKKILYV